MNHHSIDSLIKEADIAFKAGDIDALLDIYAEDTVLVVRPGTYVTGKVKIREALVAIAAHFERSLDVKQAGMELLKAGDTALILAKTIVSANNCPAMERKATHVFKRDTDKGWVCAIDNSYGHELLDANT